MKMNAPMRKRTAKVMNPENFTRPRNPRSTFERFVLILIGTGTLVDGSSAEADSRMEVTRVARLYVRLGIGAARQALKSSLPRDGSGSSPRGLDPVRHYRTWSPDPGHHAFCTGLRVGITVRGGQDAVTGH